MDRGRSRNLRMRSSSSSESGSLPFDSLISSGGLANPVGGCFSAVNNRRVDSDVAPYDGCIVVVQRSELANKENPNRRYNRLRPKALTGACAFSRSATAAAEEEGGLPT